MKTQSKTLKLYEISWAIYLKSLMYIPKYLLRHYCIILQY